MEFRILGPLEVVDDGRALDVGGAKPRALLATLLLNANQVVSSGRLIDALWGEEPPETAAKAVQVHIVRLRTALGKARLETKAPGYLLRIDPDELDLNHFQALLEQAKDASPKPPPRSYGRRLPCGEARPSTSSPASEPRPSTGSSFPMRN